MLSLSGDVSPRGIGIGRKAPHLWESKPCAPLGSLVEAETREKWQHKLTSE